MKHVRNREGNVDMKLSERTGKLVGIIPANLLPQSPSFRIGSVVGEAV